MEDSQETFISHLVELRDRLIRALIAVGIVFLALVNWARDIYTVLAAPMLAALPEGGHMIATDVAGAFFVPMKVTLMVAFLIALPYVLYQAWAFVAPGLYQHEKKLALPLLLASVVLFFIGMSFAYFIVFPTVFGFINKFAPEGVAVMTDIDKYLSFVLTTFLAFGVTFEVPVVVIVLVRVGLVSIEKLKEIRPYVIVGCFVVGAIFTPPDVLSQFMLAVPMWLLYELGIIFARFIGKPAEAETQTDANALRPLDEAAMNAELDKAEAESAANRERP
ncbi:twin-arginine translocase subunit TatC [Sulfuricystis thermophila]|uniref:twin-arginine translocase subunit TatC n=1 Tax=Sulfuricystis thermophila TaxID=2496847 RepID=UPI001036E4B4|nr:twin-arginine translocase subunit TatC [Sulfuricystis thermophila]